MYLIVTCPIYFILFIYVISNYLLNWLNHVRYLYICVVVSNNIIVTFVYVAGFERVSKKSDYFRYIYGSHKESQWICMKHNVTDTQTLQNDLRFPFIVLSPSYTSEMDLVIYNVRSVTFTTL